MAADREAGVERTGAVFVQAGGLSRRGRLEEILGLSRCQRRAVEERDGLVEYPRVARHRQIVRRD